MSAIGHGRCNCNELRRAARHLSRFYDLALASSGLKVTQHALLNHLVHIGPVTMARLAHVMAMDRATMGHNLRPLERDGLVTLAVSDVDRRSRLVSITPLGREQLRLARPYWKRAQATFEKAFGAREASSVREFMERIVGTPLPSAREK